MNDQALKTLWSAVMLSKAPPFNRALGICARWCEAPYAYGPALSKELPQDDGSTLQLFAQKAIRWTPGVGASDVTV